MFALKGVLKAETQEKIFLYLMYRDAGYAAEIVNFFNLGMTPVVKQLKKLEEDGLIVSTQSVGRSRSYTFNPRNPYVGFLKPLLAEASKRYPKDQIRDLMLPRTRPRSKGKELILDRTRTP